MNQNIKIFFWSLSAALGGFLFGFDTAVISGVEQTLQKLWHLSVFEHGLTVSIALIGTVVGSLYGGVPSDRYGRRVSLFAVGVLYLISAIGSGLAAEWYTFLIFRFIGGFGVGISSVVAPMYISEIAPPSKRGRLVALFQFNVVFGILMAYFSNYLLSGIGENAWRWMLGIQAIPSAIFIITVLLIPESPRWLILKRGKTEQARRILQTIDASEADHVVAAILKNAENTTTTSFKNLFNPAYRRPVVLAVLIALFNQLSGINAIIYYAPRIFDMAGLGEKAALLSSAGIGLINLVFTLVGITVIDKFGRRVLMTVGSFGLIVALTLVSVSFFTNAGGGLVPYYLFLFIAFFAFSQGAVIWVFISEVFPNEVRAYGQSLGSSTHWIMAAFISFSFPFIAQTFGGGPTFAFFALMMVLQLIFVRKMMPETKGTSLEQSDTPVFSH